MAAPIGNSTKDNTPGYTNLVSMVIPCYNQAQFLPEAIESVLAQSYPKIEIVVLDDGSTDSTAEIASRYSSVRYVYQQNAGLSGARNTGLRQSSDDSADALRDSRRKPSRE